MSEVKEELPPLDLVSDGEEDLPRRRSKTMSRKEMARDLRRRRLAGQIDPEEGDYTQVLQYINEFLPVKELAGRLIGVPVLRQFGLIENEQADLFLATAFGKSERALVPR